MRALAVFQQGARIGIEEGRVVVEKEGVVVQRVRLDEIDVVEVFGSVSITPSAVSVFLRREVDVVFLTMRGVYRGRLVGRPGRNAQLRLAQYEACLDPKRRLSLARAIVDAKIANQRNLLLRVQRRQRREDLANRIAELRRIRERLPAVESLESLRGLEGRAAAVYFPALGSTLMTAGFRFTQRSRRPPRDPANAVLSFGYTLLLSRMEGFVLRASLDPMIGVFHDPGYGRASLALDLIEEFRPYVVDGLMLSLFNRKQLGPLEFEDAVPHEDPLGEEGGDEPGVYLAETGRKVFFRAWGRRLRQQVFYEPLGKRFRVEEVMRQQVYAMARCLEDPTVEYVGFVPR